MYLFSRTGVQIVEAHLRLVALQLVKQLQSNTTL